MVFKFYVQMDGETFGPYSVRELMLRVKNLLTRSYGMNSVKTSKKEEFNGYEIDYDKRIVTENGVNINLTSKEYDLLLFLLENKSKAFSSICETPWHHPRNNLL